MSQSDNRLPYTRRGHKPGRGRRLDAPCALRKTNPVGGHSICPRCMEFHSNNRREQACAIRRTKRKFRTNGRGDPSPTNIGFCQARAPESPLPEGTFQVHLTHRRSDQWSPARKQSPVLFVKTFSAKSQKTPSFYRVDRSTNFRKRLDTGRETCYNVLTCRGAAFSPSRAGSAARGFNAGRLG